ncbi:MAG: hypothetical protein L3J47_00465 [Sulfurovum sp.]|nr:hypothetical protein [Sulfurovum sp.]
MRDFVTSNQVDLSINYPRSSLRLPAIVILLRNESESPQGAWLGDYMGSGHPDELAYDGGLEELLGGVASVSGMSGQGLLEFGPHRVLSATLNTLSVSDRGFYSGQFVHGVSPLVVHVVGGTGAGQQREISSNTHNLLMVSSDWLVTPDTTSVFEVRAKAAEVLGQPSKLYDRRDKSTIVERHGSLYSNKYQFQVVASSQEQVIYLYSILKGIFTLSRLFMEGQGIISMKMSGTDFTNRPEYLPDLAYMRVLTLEFETEFEVFTELDNLVESFTMCLSDGRSGEDIDVSVAVVPIGQPSTVITGP